MEFISCIQGVHFLMLILLQRVVEKEMLPVPDDHPMFMFFGAKGKNRSLMVFFDSGCSRFIMKTCFSLKGKIHHNVVIK